jgi:ectoine hydroxylase-related dioxygenase (phytanoyl-CoA dioxygenase family)
VSKNDHTLSPATSVKFGQNQTKSDKIGLGVDVISSDDHAYWTPAGMIENDTRMHVLVSLKAHGILRIRKDYVRCTSTRVYIVI